MFPQISDFLLFFVLVLFPFCFGWLDGLFLFKKKKNLSPSVSFHFSVLI